MTGNYFDSFLNLMVNDRLAVVDTEGWRGEELTIELQGRDWIVSRCQGALRSIYIPKYQCAIFTCDLEEQKVKSAVERSLLAKTKGDKVFIIILLEDDSPLQSLPKAMRLTDGIAIPARTVKDIIDFIESYVESESIPKPSLPAHANSLKDIVKLMTWRLEGLYPEHVQVLTSQYSTLAQIVEAALVTVTTTTNPNGKEAPIIISPLQEALLEVALFLGRDYYVE